MNLQRKLLELEARIKALETPKKEEKKEKTPVRKSYAKND